MSSLSSVAAITGCSSGIGRATALEFARRNYDLLLHGYRNLAGLQQTCRQVREVNGGIQLRCVTANIAQERSCRDLVHAAFAWRPTIDVWVNNAGADVLTGAARKLSFGQRLELLWQVDVAGTIRLSRLVADRMTAALDSHGGGISGRPQTPSIINMSWDQAALGMEGEPGQLFGTTKSAIAAFSRSLALSNGASHGRPAVRVNCVAPGWIKTAWGESSAADYWDRRATRESLLGRWGRPQDVAAAIAWLASPEADFVNGHCLSINGGRRFYPES